MATTEVLLVAWIHQPQQNWPTTTGITLNYKQEKQAACVHHTHRTNQGVARGWPELSSLDVAVACGRRVRDVAGSVCLLVLHQAGAPGRRNAARRAGKTGPFIHLPVWGWAMQDFALLPCLALPCLVMSLGASWWSSRLRCLLRRVSGIL